MLENINLAFQGVWSHKLRSFLTMLGIIIGIAAIITIVSTIQGTNEQIKQNLIGAGNNVVRVTINAADSQNYFDLNYSALPEGIDPVTGEQLPDGEEGELVFTCIGKEALPLIRYRTRDICSLTHEKCACGRTTVRMTKPKGRTDDMLIIRGINVFPSQIESVLLDLGMDPNYRMIVDRKNNLDTLEVQVEMNESMFSDTVRSLERVERTIADALHSTLNIAAKITLLEPKSIERSEGKAKRVIDRRKL